MPKTKISEYSTTPSSNTDINSIDLGEGTMVPSDVNNSLRQLMADLAAMNAGTDSIQDTFTLADPSDDTKKVRIDAGSVTASNTRVLTAPDSDITLAGIDLAQEFTRTQNFDATTLTDGATISWDAAQNQVTSVTLGGNRTLGAPTNLKDGAVYVLTVIQDGTGSRTLSFNAVFKFHQGAAPTLTTPASARDVLLLLRDGTNLYAIGRSLHLS